MTSRNFAFYLFSIWIFLNSLFFFSSAELKTYYAEDLCDKSYEKTLWLGNSFSGILRSTPSPFNSAECTIRLRPDPGFHVVLSIYRFSLTPGDQLTITDSDKFQVALIGEGDFPDERKSFTSTGIMTINYSWNNTYSLSPRQKFQFVFTQVHRNPCRYDEFQCRNKLCVSKDFVCDRHNHCGDNSDQEDCGPRKEYPQAQVTRRYNSSAWLITIISCSVIVAILIIVFIAMVIRNNIRRKKQLASKNSPLTIAASVPQNPSAPPATEAPPTLFARFRQSLKSIKSSATAPREEPMKDNYEVPSMYPHISSAPHNTGAENPEFKGDDA